jgi:hypothetical protein
LVALFAALILPSVGFAEEPAQADESIGETGTDPRDFAAKFMPYYRHTVLENGLEQDEFVLFGLFPFSKSFAMTYEIPLAYRRDITDTAACDTKTPDGLCTGLIPGGGVLPSPLPGVEADGTETGIGDMNLRFLYRLPEEAKVLGGDVIVGAEFVFPTANEDVLGSESFLIKPMVVYVHDLTFWPAPGAFVASMNFYNFHAWQDSSRGDVSQYIGRHFVMLPIHPSGIYALPEFQTIYDFEAEHFSLWIGPEFGKLLAPGRIVYIKPGFGISPDEDAGDREWSLETGFRWFF